MQCRVFDHGLAIVAAKTDKLVLRAAALAIVAYAVYRWLRARAIQRRLDRIGRSISSGASSVWQAIKGPLGWNRPSTHFGWHELDPAGEASSAERQRLRRLAVEVLEPLRAYVKVPLTITRRGGYHGPGNTAQRKITSQHRRGAAADVRAQGYTSTQLYDVVVRLTARGLPVGYAHAYEGGFVHVDQGPNRGRQFQAAVRAARIA